MVAGNGLRTDEIIFGPFRLMPAERLLVKGDEPVPIGTRALDLLIVMVEQAGEVVSKRELIKRVWPDLTVEEGNLRVHIVALRKALGEGRGGARYIASVHGRGYSFVAQLGRPHLIEPALRAAAATAAPESGRLPPVLKRMIGRDVAIESIASLVKTERFVSIVGPGGIGKTTMAVAVANALLAEFDQHVCFVDLGTLRDPALVASAVCSAAGCPAHVRDPVQGLHALLAGRKMLLVLDNSEHLIEAVAHLAENLFRDVPALYLLATSREALRVEGENIYFITPFDVPEEQDGLTAEQALAWPVVQLFMERAVASGYQRVLTDDEAPIIARICRQLDGIALAVELVASQAGVYGIRGTANLLDNRIGLLWQGRRSAPPRQRTLQAMLDWSYNLLSDHEQTVLRRVSVFVGHFTLDSALAVGGNGEMDEAYVADAIDGLVDKSLVWVTDRDESIFYRLADTTRFYTTAMLADSGELNSVSRCHAAHITDILKAAATGGIAPEVRNPSEFEQHIGDIRAALTWCFSDGGDTRVGVEVAARSAPILLGLSLHHECRLWCERALAALPQADRGTSCELVLRHALAIAMMFTDGLTLEVRAAIESCINLAENLGDRGRQLHLYAGLSMFLSRAGDASTLTAAERSAAIADEFGDAATGTMIKWLLTSALFAVGNQASVQHHGELALAFPQSRTDFRFFGADQRIRGIASLAMSYWLLGLPERSKQMAQQAIDEAASYGGPADLAYALTYTIIVLLWRGDLNAAEERIQRASAHTTRYSLRYLSDLVLGFKAELAIARGDFATGVALSRDAVGSLHASGYHTAEGKFLISLATGLLGSGRLDEADASIAQFLSLLQGETYPFPEALRVKAEILLARPDPDIATAEEWLHRSLASARAQSALAWELRTATTLARLWSTQGRSGEALDVLKPVYHQFTEGFETSDLKEAARLLATLKHS